MRPLAGVAIEDAVTALRCVCANPDVTVVIPGMAGIAELNQNLAAVNDSSPLSVEEEAKMRAIRDALGTQFCRRCNYCQPCSAGISISSVFLFEGYLSRYGLADWARSRYATLTKKASECIGCGACASACPQKCITPGTPYVINWAHCLQCGRCAEACPADAVRRLHP